MKTYILLLISILFYSSTQAQITITSASAVKVGTVFTTQSCDPNSFAVSAAGPNVTVNYGNVVVTDSPLVNTGINPSATPYSSLYSNTSVAFYTVSTQGNPSYVYYNSSSTKMEIAGAANANLQMIYDNPELILVFPTSYNDVYKDTAHASYKSNGIDVVMTIYSTCIADAYGNITTPMGTNPYLRIKTVQNAVDSFFSSGMLVGVSFASTLSYNYMNSNFVNSLFNYSESHTGQTDTYTASFLKSSSTGLNSVRSNETSLLLSPNPAKHIVYLSIANQIYENGVIEITDLAGKLIKSFPVDGLQHSISMLEIPLEGLSQGMHLLRLQSNGVMSKSVRLVVE